MIPAAEEKALAELERRIEAALPATRPSPDGEPETFVLSVEGRKVTPCLQEEAGRTVYAGVTADVAVVFFWQRRQDYSPMIASFAANPFLNLGDGWTATARPLLSESVEGPYLCNDAWLFEVRYQVTDGFPETPPGGVAVSMAPATGAAHEDDYERL